MSELIPIYILLSLLFCITLAIFWIGDLFAIAMLSGIYSLIAAAVFVLLDAVDVAFTEAAVGAGISTILVLSALSMTHPRNAPKHPRNTSTSAKKFPVTGALVLLCTAIGLIYGAFDLPIFGSELAPAHHHLIPEYAASTKHDIHIPNIVTAILASYRGFDTLGETVVVFTAGIGVLLIIGWPKTKQNRNKSDR